MTLQNILLKSKLIFILIVFFSGYLFSSIEDYYPYNLEPTSSNYGETGLYNLPSARFMEEGTLKLGISGSYPYEYTFITTSPFPWLESTYRYTEIKNIKYGPYSYSGNQSLKDKGFDLKIKLFNESYYLPSIALGFRDIAGTAKFASEYLVATKSIKDLDFTLGVGWGALAANGNIKNPVISLNKAFEFRDADQKLEGGTFRLEDWFSGERAAIFGGVEYSLQRYGLNLKLEYDTAIPEMGYLDPSIKVKSKWNFGVTRPIGDFVDLGLSLERGSEIRFSFVIKTNYGKQGLVPKADPPLNVIPLSIEQKKQIASNKALFYRSLNMGLKEESIYIQGASYKDSSVDVVINQMRFRSFPRAAGRAARITSALSPDEIENINVFLMNGDIEVSSISLDRRAFDKAINQSISSGELFLQSEINSPSNKPMYQQTDFQPEVIFPDVRWSMSPALRHQIGGPEAFYLGQLWWKINTSIIFRRGLTLDTVLGLDLYNNFDEFANPSYSEIPHVRSDIQEYLLQGKNNIARLKLNYFWSPYRDLFARIDFGLLEEMFGGYGGELFYRPFNSNLSMGFSFHNVKQRGFKQRFKFRKYQTETGHLSFYYDFPQSVQGHLMIGKYLAGDKGATLDLSRRFKTGFTLGVFATKTNLSSEEFGEGSFDKGFYFAIPLDMFYTDYQAGNISFGLHPLTKDGGAILNIHNSLYSILGDTGRNSLVRDWKDLLD